MLRKIRIAFAAVFFTLVTLLFLDFTGTLHTWFGWMAKIQFIPAVLAVNFGVIVLLLALTLLFGRVYCSVICPLGVFQDVVSWISGRRKRKKYRFSHSPAKSWLRVAMLAVFIVALVAGAGSLAALLDPYASFGRIVSNVFAPLWQWGNNFLAWVAERADSYAFYGKEVWLKSLPTFVVAIVTLVAIVFLAWKHGRTYCNAICPVGTVLGWVSKFSLFAIKIDKDKCNACGLCSRRCKAACIDGAKHQVDYSRCVACMDCIDTCTHDAICFTLRKNLKGGGSQEKSSAPAESAPAKGESAVAKETVATGRRTFIATAAIAASSAALKAQEKKVDGGLAAIKKRKIPTRATAIVPAGAVSLKNFHQHCTACQLCVSVCPNDVLRPSTGLLNLMQPEMSYERGYCRPECTKCSDVCPAGAILPISVERKSSTRIGHAVWVRENCVPLTDGVSCGNCARHCPSGAIRMVRINPDDPDSLKIPVVNTERCIGCGACENLCPARPFAAIYVEGHEVHSEM